MKNLKIYFLTFLALAIVSACEEEYTVEFVASENADTVVFTNTFAAQYLLSEALEDNIAERFVWNAPDFGAPVNVTYELQGTTDPTFATSEVVGSTSATNLGVTIAQLIGFAEDLGLDDDPATTTDAGLPNNTGQVYFRLRAFTGTGGASAIELMSAVQALNLVWVEREPAGAGCPSLWVVGAGAPDAGWNWNTPVEFTCDNNVYTARLTLANETFRFFEEEGNWDSGLNFLHFNDEGYTIDANFEDANDGDRNFRFIGTPGIYEMVVDANAKTITLTASTPIYLVGAGVGGWSFASAPVMVEGPPYVYSATATFSNDLFRMFTGAPDDWNSSLNYPYYEDEGYTIDERFEGQAEPDYNFRFIGTPGEYTLTIDNKQKIISLQ